MEKENTTRPVKWTVEPIFGKDKTPITYRGTFHGWRKVTTEFEEYIEALIEKEDGSMTMVLATNIQFSDVRKRVPVLGD